MLNREKYAKEIIEIAVESRLAVEDGKPVKCFGINCTNCDLCGTKKSCIENGIEWLNSEYVEPPVDWTKVPVNTPILVRNSEEETWRKSILQNMSMKRCMRGQESPRIYSIGKWQSWQKVRMCRNGSFACIINHIYMGSAG